MTSKAQDIIDALKSVDFDYDMFLGELVDEALLIIEDHVDMKKIVELALHRFEDKLPPGIPMLISIVGAGGVDKLLSGFIISALKRWIEDGGIQKIIDKYTKKDDDEKPPVDEKPIPVILPKMKKFMPSGSPKLLWQGHDNAPVTVSSNGWTYTATGDGFYNGRKFGTCLWKLPPGKDPMVRHNWIFMRGTAGKCYGIVCIGNELFLLQSDKGSGYEGMQDCRVWDVFKDARSNRTFQQSLAGDGANWFVVQYGPGHRSGPDQSNKYIVDIGCVTHAGHGHGQANYNFITPIKLWRGDIRSLVSFRRIGIAKGVDGPRNKWTTTMSITYIEEHRQFLAGGGDWTASEVYQCVSEGNNLLGPYKLRDRDTFDPPMVHNSYKNGTRWTGVFTLCYFCLRGQWYRMLSGHNPDHSSDKAVKDDSVWCQKVKVIMP